MASKLNPRGSLLRQERSQVLFNCGGFLTPDRWATLLRKMFPKLHEFDKRRGLSVPPNRGQIVKGSLNEDRQVRAISCDISRHCAEILFCLVDAVSTDAPSWEKTRVVLVAIFSSPSCVSSRSCPPPSSSPRPSPAPTHTHNPFKAHTPPPPRTSTHTHTPTRTLHAHTTTTTRKH